MSKAREVAQNKTPKNEGFSVNHSILVTII